MSSDRRALILAVVVIVILLLAGWPSVHADLSGFWHALTHNP